MEMWLQLFLAHSGVIYFTKSVEKVACMCITTYVQFTINYVVLYGLWLFLRSVKYDTTSVVR